MKPARLDGKRIAILVADGFEQIEMRVPKEALERAGAETAIISLGGHAKVKGWNRTEWGDESPVAETCDRADPEEFDALLLPGGVMNADALRRDSFAVDFVRAFFAASKPVAAICHGAQILIDAGVVNGRQMTSFESIHKDLENAGASWVDHEVVVDHGLVTSRKPADLPAFCKHMLFEFAASPRDARASVLPHNVNGSGAIHGELLGER